MMQPFGENNITAVMRLSSQFYQCCILFQMEILLNKQSVDALSTIVHKNKIREVGKNYCFKLKNAIPRYMLTFLGCNLCFFNPFVLNAPFLCPPCKRKKTSRFSDVYSGQRKGALGTNGLTKYFRFSYYFKESAWFSDWMNQSTCGRLFMENISYKHGCISIMRNLPK